MEFLCSFFTFWMIYGTVVGAPPYPGFKGCFVMHASQDIVFLWVLLLVWDAHRCKYIIKCPSSDWRGSIVDAHGGTYHPSMWVVLVLKIGSAHLIFSMLDKKGGNSSLMAVVYRDGKCLFFVLTARLNLDVGIIYYLYLFGRFRAGNEWANHLWNLSCINIILVKTLPVSWAPFHLFHTF